MKMKTKAALLFAVLLFGSLPGWAAERFEAGVEYLDLASPPTLVAPDDGRVEVTLFFWYGCGACALADPAFTEWARGQPQTVAIAKLPTTYAEPWNMHARIFMTLEEMGVEKNVHLKIFEAFKTPEGMVRTEDDLPDFAKSMGLDADAFMTAYKSAAVDTRMERLMKLVEAYNPQVVPSIVVDGRYITDLGRVEDPTELLELVDVLIEKAEKTRAAQK